MVNALLAGIVGSVLLAPFVSLTQVRFTASEPFLTTFEYLFVMMFGLTYMRSSLRRSSGLAALPIDKALMWISIPLIVFGLARTGWIAAMVIVAMASMWTRRKAVWVVVPLVALTVLTVPVFRERVLSSVDTGGGFGAEALSKLSTGRWPLWVYLWDRGSDALPAGNGFGFEWSLSSEEVFGFAGDFESESSVFIFPHDDFIYLFVELGIVGAVLLLIQWVQVLRATRYLSGRGRESFAQYGARVLTPVIVG